MATWAIIPAKRFDRAKSRLAPALSPDERRVLAESMFRRVAGAALDCDLIDGLLVVTDGDDVAQAARSLGAHVARDAPAGLAASIDRAIDSLGEIDPEAGRVVVLMGDLPRVTSSDIRTLVAALSQAPAAIAPDRQQEGTNGLGLRLPRSLPTAFGRHGSFAEHQRRLEAAGQATSVVMEAGLEVDIDSPADLEFIEDGRIHLGAAL